MHVPRSARPQSLTRGRLGEGRHQRDHRPDASGVREKLVLPVWESGGKVRRTDRRRRDHSRPHAPGAITRLRGYEELQSLLPCRIGDRYPRLAQGIQRLTGGIRVRVIARKLRPTAVGALPGDEIASGRFGLLRRCCAHTRPITRNAASSVDCGGVARSQSLARCSATSRSPDSSSGMKNCIARTAVAVAVNRLLECGGRKSEVIQWPSRCHDAIRRAYTLIVRSRRAPRRRLPPIAAGSAARASRRSAPPAMSARRPCGR